MSEKYKPAQGDIVKVGHWNGVVLDALLSSTTGNTIFKILFVKNAFKQQAPELLELETLNEMGGGVSLSTRAALDLEIAQYRKAIEIRLGELEALLPEKLPA